MTNYFDTIHRAFVFYGAAEKFQDTSFWLSVVEILAPLTGKSTYGSVVNPLFIDNSTHDIVKSKSRKWTKTDIESWIQAGSAQLQLDSVSVYFPGLKESQALKITPDIYIRASKNTSPKETRYQFVFMLVVKKQLLEKVGDEELNQMIRELDSLFETRFKVKITRAWAVKENQVAYTDSFQDLFPSMILQLGNEFIIREGYEEWMAF